MTVKSHPLQSLEKVAPKFIFFAHIHSDPSTLPIAVTSHFLFSPSRFVLTCSFFLFCFYLLPANVYPSAYPPLSTVFVPSCLQSTLLEWISMSAALLPSFLKPISYSSHIIYILIVCFTSALSFANYFSSVSSSGRYCIFMSMGEAPSTFWYCSRTHKTFYLMAVECKKYMDNLGSRDWNPGVPSPKLCTEL